MHTRTRSGFSLVELLIVIATISILATIATVSYLGVRYRGNDTAVQEDIGKYADSLNVYFSANSSYPTDQTKLLTIKNVIFSTKNYKTTANAVLYCVDTAAASSGAAMAVIAKSQSGKTFFIKDEGALQDFTGTFPSGNTTTDCKAANSAISTVTAIWVHNATRADSSGVSSGGWLVSVLQQ